MHCANCFLQEQTPCRTNLEKIRPAVCGRAFFVMAFQPGWGKPCGVGSGGTKNGGFRGGGGCKSEANVLEYTER